MKPEHLKALRECCTDDAAFERLQQILMQVEAEQPLGRSVPPVPLSASGADSGVGQAQKWMETPFQGADHLVRVLLENAVDIIVVLDEQGFFRYCSPSAERVLGYRLEDVVGHHATEFVHPDDGLLILHVLQAAALKPGISQPPIEYRVRHGEGSWRVFEAIATSLLEHPVIRGVVVNCYDITQRVQAEAALQAANRQIVNILESITDAFISLDRDGRLTYLNQQAVQLIQRSQPEGFPDLLGHRLWDIVPDLQGTAFERELQQALATEPTEITVTVEELYLPLGVWFEARIFPSADGVSIFLLDITERRAAQAELLEMSTALGNAVEGIARLSRDGYYIALNRAYAAVLGYQQEELIGLPWQLTIHPEDRAAVELAHRQAVQQGKAAVEARALRQDGFAFYQEIVVVPTYDWDDQLVGCHCFTRDITERKRVETALRQQAEREQLLGAIARRIRQSLDLDITLNTTVLEVRQFLGTDRVVIYHCEPDNGCVVLAEAVEPPWHPLIGQRMEQAYFEPIHRIYRQGKYLVLNDVQRVKLANKTLTNLIRQDQVRAVLGVPILQGQRLWGILVAHQCSGPRVWQPFAIELLEQLATQVAIAIQQSELYCQVQQLNTDLERQVQERTAQLEQLLDYESMLKRITDAVRDSLDEDQILQTAVQELVLGLGLDGCDAAIYNLEQRTSTICHEYLRSNIAVAQGAVLPMDESPEWYRQLLDGQFFQFCFNYDSFRLQYRQHTVLAYPLVDDQQVLGDLWLFKPCNGIFSELEIRLVQQIATQCAIAIRQARLYQTAQAQVAALEQLHQLKDDFLSTVSHELRTPMSNMKMAIHLLKQSQTPERQERYLNILQTECNREIELINDLLDLQRLEASSYPFELVPVELRAYLLQLVEPFYGRAQQRQQSLQVQLPTKPLPFTTDKASLERIVVELLNNACKYTPPGGAIQVEVQVSGGASHTPPELSLSVRNQAEIPRSELGQIFNKFYRVPNGDRWQQGGTGLGLALVQQLVTQLGGTIQVSSDHGWTTFSIALLDLKPAEPKLPQENLF